MSTSNLSLIIHGALALAIIAASVVLAIDLKAIPADVVGLFGVILGVAGVNGTVAARTVTSNSTTDQTTTPAPPLQGGPVA